MPITTTNLTSNFDASDNDHIWVNYQSGSPYHNTVPVDGDTIRAWDNEEAGDYQFKPLPEGSSQPVWRQAVPLLALPCLDFNRVAQHRMGMYNRAGTVATPISSLIANNAFTIYVAFLVESATLNTSNAFSNHCILGDGNTAYMGLHYRIDAGQLILQGYNWDGSDDHAERNISLNTPHLARFRHGGGQIRLSVDGGAEASVASGNTQVISGSMQLGCVIPGGGRDHDGRIGQVVTYNIDQGTTDMDNTTEFLYAKWVTGVSAIRQPIVSCSA